MEHNLLTLQLFAQMDAAVAQAPGVAPRWPEFPASLRTRALSEVRKVLAKMISDVTMRQEEVTVARHLPRLQGWHIRFATALLRSPSTHSEVIPIVPSHLSTN